MNNLLIPRQNMLGSYAIAQLPRTTYTSKHVDTDLHIIAITDWQPCLKVSTTGALVLLLAKCYDNKMVG